MTNNEQEEIFCDSTAHYLGCYCHEKHRNNYIEFLENIKEAATNLMSVTDLGNTTNKEWFLDLHKTLEACYKWEQNNNVGG